MTDFMDLDNLSQHERGLLDLAIPFAKEIAEATGKLPVRDAIRIYLKCSQFSAGRILKAISDNKLVAAPEGVEGFEASKEENVIEKDKWSITLPKTRIHTLEDLLKHFEVDLNVWEVRRFVVNKWEMGFIKKVSKTEYTDTDTSIETGEPSKDTGSISGLAGTDTEKTEALKRGKNKTKHTDYNRESDHQPLYQVKAELARKITHTVEHYARENALLRSRLAKSNLAVASERKTIKYLAQNHAGYDDLLSDVKNFVDILGDFQLPKELIVPAKPQFVPAVAKGHSEDAVFMLSDTHFGDVIRHEDTSGFPEFDLVISANRFGYVMQKAKQVLSLHRAMYPIKKLYVWIGGDIGNGILHDAPNSNALFTPAQVHFSYHMLKFGIEELLTLTQPDPKTGVRVIEDIVLLFTVGNHMRMDEKMPHKYQAQRTLDWLIYQFIIERFQSNPHVSVRQEMSPFIFENIRGHRHMFAHGMQVGFRNSPDAQNKAIGQFLMLATRLFDSPEWRKKNGLQGETFSRACIGDIHIPISYPRFKSNGSLNGQNELGVNWTLEPIPAGQQIWGVADKHQETWQYFLECTQIQRAQEDFNVYGTFAAEYAKRIGRC